MRKIIKWNENWDFLKGENNPLASGEFEQINLPHTWNAIDGQDGGDDYYRGSCLYKKILKLSDIEKADEYYLEINGANSSCDVFVNGENVCHHDGGYSTFRVNLTQKLKDENEIAVVVDNAPNDHVYPQFADFTFYGGLYRDVNIIAVDKTHFDLDYYGGKGLVVTPVIDGVNANVEIEVYTTDLENAKLRYVIEDNEQNVLFDFTTDSKKVMYVIENAHLWQARKDPYLYTAKVEIVDGSVLDSVDAKFGCRSFSVDPERGFILNGEEYPLHGVSRHQDRLGIGNALLPEH
ncbi:MAG: glycoside hydrolase family 2 protein, partial [Clostridia bacterium]|nr:glycoside hydrolase family 2 protein [Clostridia bacterium]